VAQNAGYAEGSEQLQSACRVGAVAPMYDTRRIGSTLPHIGGESSLTKRAPLRQSARHPGE
jgi:hypothetical protein